MQHGVRPRFWFALGATAGLALLWQFASPELRMCGSIRNESNETMWVVETDSGRAVAHLLGPHRRSPPDVDADGVRSEEERPIEGHRSWWKVRDISDAVVHERGADLEISCQTCSAVGDREFGDVRYDRTPGWGEPLGSH